MADKFTLILRAVVDGSLNGEATSIAHREVVYQGTAVGREHVVPILNEFLLSLGYDGLEDPDAYFMVDDEEDED